MKGAKVCSRCRYKDGKGGLKHYIVDKIYDSITHHSVIANSKRHPIEQPNDPTIRYIPLTQGKYAIVDAGVYEYLTHWNWSIKKGLGNLLYAVRCINRTGIPQQTISMHRDIMGLEKGDGLTVDHINHNTLDNRRSNLRIATYSQNCANKGVSSSNTSGVKGLSWQSSLRRWQVQFKKNGKPTWVGFKSIDDAVEFLCQKSTEIYGEFAVLPTLEQIEFAKSKRLKYQLKEDEMNALLDGDGLATLQVNGTWTIRGISECSLRKIGKLRKN
jgi:hypothetical protein